MIPFILFYKTLGIFFNEIMNKFITTTFLIFLFVFFISCSHQTTRKIEADALISTLKPKIIEAEAIIKKEKATNFRITESPLPSKYFLSKISFINSQIGWLTEFDRSDSDPSAITKNLYKTLDGGKFWQKSQIKLPKDSRIKDFFFIDEKTGWLILQNNAPVFESEKIRSWFLKTSDGGNKWTVLLEKEAVSLERIEFTNKKDGWLLGNKNSDSPINFEGRILVTEDGGVTWKNVGNQIIKNTDDDWFTDFYIIDSDKAIVSTAIEFFETNDKGVSWTKRDVNFHKAFRDKAIAGIEESLGNITLLDNSVLAFGQGFANYMEGSHSYLGFEESDKSWIIRRFDGENVNGTFILEDIIFLSRNEIIACGSLVIYSEFNIKDSGVILFSKDGGKTFSIVHQNKESSVISSISKINESQFIAVGNKGLIINLELQNPTN
jgi:photosystem II stability/assembly factor-like uncharacterized protein